MKWESTWSLDRIEALGRSMEPENIADVLGPGVEIPMFFVLFIGKQTHWFVRGDLALVNL